MVSNRTYGLLISVFYSTIFKGTIFSWCLTFGFFGRKRPFKIGYTLRPDFTSKLVHVLAFGTPKFYIAPYDKIKHELVKLSSNCDVKSGLRGTNSCLIELTPFEKRYKNENGSGLQNCFS